MSVNRGDVERVVSLVATERGRRSVGEVEGTRVNFSATSLGRDDRLADSTNGTDLKGR